MHTEEHNEQIIPEFMCMCVRRSKDLLKEKNHCVWIVVHVSLYAWWVIKWFKHKKGNDTVIAVYICETGSVCDLKFDFFVYTKQLNQVKIPHKKHKHTNGNGTFSVRSIWFCVFCGCTTANCSTDEFPFGKWTSVAVVVIILVYMFLCCVVDVAAAAIRRWSVCNAWAIRITTFNVQNLLCLFFVCSVGICFRYLCSGQREYWECVRASVFHFQM